MTMPAPRTPLLFLCCTLMAACGGSGPDPSAPVADGTGTAAVAPAGDPAQALAGNMPRTDGTYRAVLRGVGYVMRFLPDGQVMLVAGMADAVPALVEQLVPEATVGGNSVVHRTVVRIEGDSVLFTTSGGKGEIDYQGLRLGADSIRFRKYSHINGREATLTYHFVPFTSPAQ